MIRGPLIVNTWSESETKTDKTMEESPTDWETDNEEEENELVPKNNGTSVVSELF